MKGWELSFLGIMMALSTGSFALQAYAQQVEANPAETYRAYHQALRLLDMERIRARWLPDEAIAKDEEALTKEVLWMRQMFPPEIMVRHEKIIGGDAFLTVVGIYPNGGRSEGTVYLVKTVDRWRVKEEKWGFIELPPPPPAPKGEGTIEGIVALPPIDRQGDLYIFAILENQNYPSAFTVIPKDRIVWKVVPYRITDLPSGRYWVYAYWDTAPPFMDAERRNFAVFTGDYAGEFITAVTLYEGETRSRVDFSCSRDLKAKEEENYGTRYSLVDLGISTSSEGKLVFLLSIRNTDDKPVRNISLACRINGKELTYTASAPGTLILPNEVRAFDVTTCYDSYLFFSEKVWLDETLSKNQLNIEIVSRDNESRLNKEIVIP